MTVKDTLGELGTTHSVTGHPHFVVCFGTGLVVFFLEVFEP